MTLALAVASGSASALESATVGSQATQATVGVINSKVDTSIAALQAKLDKMSACEAQRKFYAPSDPKKDANGCVGVGDYDLNMAGSSNINLVNGRVYGKQSGANNWAGLFYGPTGNYGGVYGTGDTYGVYGYAPGPGSASATVFGVYGGTTTGYGVTGVSTNNVGVRGASDNGWGGYFTGASGMYSYGSNGYGLEAGSTNSWAGVFDGVGSAGGVYIRNGNNNAQLCVNGSCTTSMPAPIGCNFPGGFMDVHGDHGDCWDDVGIYCDSSGHVSYMSRCP
jgi:hypothetical protein